MGTCWNDASKISFHSNHTLRFGTPLDPNRDRSRAQLQNSQLGGEECRFGGRTPHRESQADLSHGENVGK